MIINGKALIEVAPIKNMITSKENVSGVSYGLGEAGYDIRISQDITYLPNEIDGPYIKVVHSNGCTIRSSDYGEIINGRFTIASALEEFEMPDNLAGIVHDKSTWARKGLSVFNTVIEPGWKGFLTLELVYHGNNYLHIPAGTGIAQVIFHELKETSKYIGKYQNQPNRPVNAILK